jgi:hypothetical protein
MSFFQKYKLSVAFLLYLLLAIIATCQIYFHPLSPFVPSGKLYTGYNNYIIFKQSFFHLISHKDLYAPYPAEQWDLYKYSPSFAFLFGSLAWMPNFIGLLLWNMLNALLLFYAIKLLPQFSDAKKCFILLFCAVEMLGSLQNAQSNSLIAGLFILCFALLERSKYLWATLCIVLSIYIKLFGVVAFSLYLFYPNKIKLAAYTLFWFIFLGVLPLFAINFTQLTTLYSSWLHLLQSDRSGALSLSVQGIAENWFGVSSYSLPILAAGIVLFCLPLLLCIKQYGSYSFKLQILASILIWCVIFNHKAESPTFIIAISGIAIWYFSQQKNIPNLILLLLALLFTSLSSGDLFPRYIRDHFFIPYNIKAVMTIVIWVKLSLHLILSRKIIPVQANT